MAISATSFAKTPQAVGDSYLFYEDQLLLAYLPDGTIVPLDVLSNDRGGAAKVLYSVDDGRTYNAVSSPNDLLLADALTNGKSVWEAIQSTVNGTPLVADDVLRIDNGKIDLDITHSLLALTGTTDVNVLAAGDHIHDSFVYAIRLGNGTLSWATTTVDVYGQNDAASISGVATGTLTEDDTNPVTGTLTVSDADHGESHTQSANNVASLGGLGTYSVDADGHWSYTVNTALVQYLNAGQSTTDSFVVDSLDGTAHQTVSVTITGIDEGLSFARTDYPAGAGPEWFAIADLNGDGKLDLALPDVYANTISVLLGTGGGGFAAPIALSTGFSHPHSVATTDLNGDGKLDLVISDDAGVGVAIGNGDGSFQPLTLYPTVSSGSATIADLNGDGKLDVIAANQYSSVISVLLGNGDGTFQSQTTYAAGDGPGWIAVGDLNGDDKLDLAVSDNGSTGLAVLLGNGDGSFQAPTIYTTGTTYGVAIGDLNGDGKPDLVAGTSSGVQILLGNGDGSLQVATIYAAESGAHEVAIGDLNGDGNPDIAASNSQSNTLSVLLGNGDGTFQPESSFAVGNNPFSVAIADLNGDGKLDLAVSNVEGGTISILLN